MGQASWAEVTHDGDKVADYNATHESGKDTSGKADEAYNEDNDEE